MLPIHSRSSRSARSGNSRRRSTRCLLLGSSLLALLLPAVLTAGPLETARGVAIAPQLSGCEGGLQIDDGTAESGLFARDLAMRFEPPAGEAEIETVCVCWNTTGEARDLEYDLVIRATDGPGGEPGTELARVAATATGVTTDRRFFQHDLSALDLALPEEPFYLGVETEYNSSVAFICTDFDAANDTPVYRRGSIGGWIEVEDTVLMIRAALAGDGPPPPPDDPVVDPAYPDFRFWVRITGPATLIPGTREPECIDETVCFSGALPGRSEVFVRIVGPKPNGRLWPTLVKFTTSQVEVWIQQVSTGQLRYYLLEGASPGFDELPGLFDRDGFAP